MAFVLSVASIVLLFAMDALKQRRSSSGGPAERAPVGAADVQVVP